MMSGNKSAGIVRGGRCRSPQAGMTLIELMIAVTVLAIGLGGTMALIGTAILTNNRNKLDTTGTTISQTVMEEILQQGANATSTFTITDCLGNNYTIDPTSSTSGRGAPLNGNGNIDFTQALNPTSGYNMNYIVCKANGNQATFDVRWNITTLTSSATAVYTKRITIAARPVNASANGQYAGLLFAIPVNLTGVAGDYPN